MWKPRIEAKIGKLLGGNCEKLKSQENISLQCVVHNYLLAVYQFWLQFWVSTLFFCREYFLFRKESPIGLETGLFGLFDEVVFCCTDGCNWFWSDIFIDNFQFQQG